jgi:hypothetical protein
MPPLPWTAAPAADAISDEVVVMASLLQLDSLRRAPGSCAPQWRSVGRFLSRRGLWESP